MLGRSCAPRGSYTRRSSFDGRDEELGWAADPTFAFGVRYRHSWQEQVPGDASIRRWRALPPRGTAALTSGACTTASPRPLAFRSGSARRHAQSRPSSSGRSPSRNPPSATMNSGPMSKPTRSSRNAGLRPSKPCPMNCTTQPTRKRPRPAPSHSDVGPAASLAPPHQAQRGEEDHGDAKRPVEQQVVDQGRDTDDHRRRDGQPPGHEENGPGEQEHDREVDRRDSDEVTGDVTPVTVVPRVLRQLLTHRLHPRALQLHLVHRLLHRGNDFSSSAFSASSSSSSMIFSTPPAPICTGTPMK